MIAWLITLKEHDTERDKHNKIIVIVKQKITKICKNGFI